MKSVYIPKVRRINSISSGSELLIKIIFSVYSILCVFPLLLVLAVSFSSENAIAVSGYKIIPQEFSLRAYELLIGSGGKIGRAYATTIFTTLVGTFLAILISASLAYPISRKDFKYRNKFAFFVYFTMLFNGGMVPLYLVYTQLIPLKNSLLALIIPNMISAFYVLLMRTYFVQNIPDSIVESAEIDGASVYRIFFTIILPLAKPVLATVGLFTAMSYWNDFFRNMLFFFNDKVMNLQYLLYRIQQHIEFMSSNPEVASRMLANGGVIPNETARMAMVIITIGPIIFIYPFVQKYFVKGLTIGAVKG